MQKLCAPLSITHVIIDLDIGGAELMLKRLVLNSDPKRYTHRVLVLGVEGVVGKELEHAGIEVCYLGLRGMWDLPMVFIRLLLEIRAHRPSIVQSWMYHSDLLAGLAAKVGTRAKVIWGVRTTDPAVGNAPFTLAIARHCARLSAVLPDRIICAADVSRRSHIKLGYSASRMYVVPNGFDIDRYRLSSNARTQLRNDWGLSETAIVVGAVGRLNDAKDFKNLISALLELMPHFPSLHAVFVGRDLEIENDRVRAWFPTPEFLNRFRFMGERSDMPECLSTLDIFCLSSRSEGFPNVLGEAMASGLPCVTTDVGDAALLVADTGSVVPPENAKALAGAIEVLVNRTPAQRAEIGRRARTRIEEHFSLASTVREYERHYNSLTNEI